MFWTSTNPDIKIIYVTEFAEESREVDFSELFLGSKWVYGLDLFKQLYGLC